MIGAEIVCTDEACAATVDVTVDSIDELDLLTCDDCGCTMHAIALWEATELRPSAPVIPLRPTRNPLAA